MDNTDALTKRVQERDFWKHGMEGEFWRRVHDLMHAHLAHLRNSFNTLPIESLDDAARLANLRGQITATHFMMNIPTMMLQDAQQDMDAQLIEEQEEQNA